MKIHNSIRKSIYTMCSSLCKFHNTYQIQNIPVNHMVVNDTPDDFLAYSYNQPVYMLFTENNDLIVNLYLRHNNIIHDDIQYIIGSIFSLFGIYTFIIKIIEAITRDV
jgi:hypothetical protein